MSRNKSPKRVVIYGGGMAGAILAKELSHSVNVVLVDPNDYFEVPMATPRSLINPSFADSAIIPFAQALPHVTRIRGKLMELKPNGVGLVQLSEGTTTQISADVTVLATGSHFGNILMRGTDSTAPERKAFYRAYSQHLKAAQRILIVGGGPIGVEVAGEISEIYPQKAITMIESGERLLKGTTAKASAVATNRLQQRGVTIYTQERLINAPCSPSEVFTQAGVATTSSGRQLAYDLLIWCTGGKPNTHYMTGHYAHLLNDKGQIKVAPSLRVIGLPHIFALGDITDLDENKMAWHITSQVKHAKINILRVLSGQLNESALKVHQAQTNNPMMAVTLGSREGVLYLPVLGVVACPLLNRTAKAGHMLVPKYRKILQV